MKQVIWISLSSSARYIYTQDMGRVREDNSYLFFLFSQPNHMLWVLKNCYYRPLVKSAYQKISQPKHMS